MFEKIKESVKKNKKEVTAISIVAGAMLLSYLKGYNAAYRKAYDTYILHGPWPFREEA